MAKEKKLVQAITSMDEDFAQWYTDVVKKAELCGYTSVKGCMAIKPAGYAIWENIQHELDRRFKETGVENVYMPIFIPESLLDKEKDHVEGFAPEVANDHIFRYFHDSCRLFCFITRYISCCLHVQKSQCFLFLCKSPKLSS